MKNLCTLALAGALAFGTGMVTAQQTNKNQVNQNPPAPSTTSADVEGGGASIPKPNDTKAVRSARKAIPRKEGGANTPGSKGTAANLENPSHNTNAEVAGTPAASAEENVDRAR